MVEIPVGKPDDEERVERAVEALKKGSGRRYEEIMSKAGKFLAEINANLQKEMVYETEEGRILESPEHIMAMMLAGKTLRPIARPEEKPLVVTKGPILIQGEKKP